MGRGDFRELKSWETMGVESGVGSLLAVTRCQLPSPPKATGYSERSALFGNTCYLSNSESWPARSLPTMGGFFLSDENSGRILDVILAARNVKS